MVRWVLIIALVILLWQGEGDIVDGAGAVFDTFTKGKRLTKATYDKETGRVDRSPQALADEAGTSLDIYALARMIASEEGRSSDRHKAAVAWAVKNYARRVGKTISELTLGAKNPKNRGLFGTQRDLDPTSSNYRGSDRYCSTATDPYEGDLDIAIQVYTGDLADFTGGADQFDRPAGEENPTKVAANRLASGSVPVEVPGVDSSELRFWRKVA